MTSWLSRVRFILNLVVAAVAVALGFVLVALAGDGDIARTPWKPIGICLIAAGAVGLLLTSVVRAYRTESADADAHHLEREHVEHHH